MCGIAGFFHLQEVAADDWQGVLHDMTRTLVHRGPDDEGYYADGRTFLGHRRLSVVDLETGHQPVSNQSGTVRIVFNGEIYNYLELRGVLESKGHRFRTRSDTETIVHAYEEWGAQCLAQLRGMFAFALWDARRRQILLARDRLGKKPLYYARVGNTLVFGSEIKALLRFPGLDREIDCEALSDYLSLLYVPRDKSIFRRIRKLLPAHYLLADAQQTTLQPYWEINFAAEPASEAIAARRLRELLQEAVTLRMRSDVPLGAFLSGGVDSSAVVALMQQRSALPVMTASIGFKDAAFDESPYARSAARYLHTDHQEAVLEPDSVDSLQQLVWHYDEPFGDSSAIPTFRVAQLARRRVTVALSGDGGDESFAGYRRYAFDVRENRLRQLIPAFLRQPLFGLLGALYPKADFLPQVFRGKAFLGNIARPPWEAYLHSVSGIAEDDKISLLDPDLQRSLGGYRTAHIFETLYHAAPAADALSRIQYIDFKTYLPDDILTKVDRASMATSLEVRCPLLDHHVVEYAAALPAQLKLNGSNGKIIFKRAVHDLLPPQILQRPKMGFALPLAAWLRKELRPLVEEEVLAGDHAMFDTAVLRRMWQQHQSGARERTAELWGVLMFNLWHRTWASGTQRRAELHS